MKAFSRRFLGLIGYHEFSDRFVMLGFRIEEVAIETRYAEESSSVDIPSSMRYIAETMGELYRARRDRDRLRQEFVERENALGL